MAIAIPAQYSKSISYISRNSDILVPVAIVSMLIFMVIPLPTILLDLLLSLSITLSLVIILVSTYIHSPLEFSSFPTVLLLITLFRLSLNIATTRMILLHGDQGTMAAGRVIKAFGSFVVGGNYIVGAIVFVILVIINFVVITKGSGRIAEVAARFTLDAMPGKQMSIDADLNSGLIDEEEARARRKMIAKEADFYGAMDGASKFVRGDAIAGIIITLINIVGGLTIGVLQNGMSFAQAAQNYTLMTVGDGLAGQIPALIISTAAGIVVSRAGSDDSLAKGLVSQMLAQPRAIAIAAGVLFVLGLFPGLPTVPFMILSIVVGTTAYMVIQKHRASDRKAEEMKTVKAKIKPQEGLDILPPLDILALEVGYGLISMVDVEQDGELLDRIRSLRKQFGYEMGIVVPPVHIQDNMQLKPSEYRILLKGNEIAKGELVMNHLLAMNPGTAHEKIDGIATKEPTYGLPAFWIGEGQREDAMTKGYTVVDLSTVVVTHLSDVIRRHAHELLGRQEVQQLLDNVKESHPKVVEELVPDLLSIGAIVKVLQNLLREQIPVRDLLTILETLADWAPITTDTDMLTEYVRQALARTITRMYQSEDGSLAVITLDQNVETIIANSIKQGEHGKAFLAIDPDVAQKIMLLLGKESEKIAAEGHQPVVLCSARIRYFLRQMVERFFPDMIILSYNEILNDIKVQSLGTVELSDAD
ncbi:MAG: flagellar biosynthesis protein FlhA [Deltaproteobacteria bacterium]|nr:flagellar biosynthesis protein FlhA [Deltaproteobacteria bacterium]